MTSRVGVVRLSVVVPKGVASFIKDVSRFGGVRLSLKEWAEAELVQSARAMIDTISTEDLILKDALVKRYGLEKDSEGS